MFVRFAYIWFMLMVMATTIFIIYASIIPKRTYSPPHNLEIIPIEESDASDEYIHSRIRSERPNLANSLEHIINSRGQKLHVRSYWPTEGPTKSIVFFFHGYAGHQNRPTQAYIARELNAQKIACVMFDFHGHGYSDGHRGRIAQYSDLIDDAISVLAAVYMPTPYPSNQANLRIPSIAQQLPFFISGFSMGGATAIATSIAISSDKRYTKIKQKFRGMILAAPMIQVRDVSTIIKTSLKMPIQTIFDKVPFDVSSHVNIHDIWRPYYGDYVISDSYPKNPAGLTYADAPWITTAQSILQFTESMPELLPQVDCPFIVLHDPKDSITNVDGSYALMKEASSKHKHMVSMHGAKHDLVANRTHMFIHRVIEWMRGFE